MRLEQLYYIQSLKETQSLSKTAELMSISHQSISKSIKALEKELSIKILDRSSQGVTFTEEGLILYHYAQEVIDCTIKTQKELAPYQNLKHQISPKQTLHLFSHPRYIAPQLLDFIKQFRMNYSSIQIILHTASTYESLQKINFVENTLLLSACGSHRKELASSDAIAFATEKNLQHCVLSVQELYACVHKQSTLMKLQPYIDTQGSESTSCVSFNYSFRITNTHYNPQFVVDGYEQQKNLIKQENCFGRYTQYEFETFFSKNYTLFPLKHSMFQAAVVLYPADAVPAITILLEQMQHFLRF